MKLIIVNGPSGVGKSTLVERLHAEMPLCLLVDIDSIRRFITSYRENLKESSELSFRLAEAMLNSYLTSGNSVIIDKTLLYADEVLDTFIAIGKQHGAEVHEFILSVDKDTLINRAEARGFRPGGLLTPEKVIKHWEGSQRLISDRKDAIVIDTSQLDAEEVYLKLKEHLRV